jgi:hypothetical protein
VSFEKNLVKVLMPAYRSSPVLVIRVSVFPGLLVIISVVEPTLLKRQTPLALDGKSLANYLMEL